MAEILVRPQNKSLLSKFSGVISQLKLIYCAH